MFFKLLMLFILVPLIELYFLLEVSQFIGVLTTVMIIIFTGAAGVSIAKRQGYQVVRNIRSTLNAGKMPTDDLISALLILIGGVTLLTPGFITDITGFLLILPGSRDLIAALVKKYFVKYVKENKVEVHYRNQFNQRRSSSEEQDDYKDEFIDVEAEKVEEEDSK